MLEIGHKESPMPYTCNDEETLPMKYNSIQDPARLVFNDDITVSEHVNLGDMAKQAIEQLQKADRYGPDMRSSRFMLIEDVALALVRVCKQIKP